MELWQEMLGGLTEEERKEFVLQIKALLELRCYQALDEIRTVLRNDTLSDSACFERLRRSYVPWKESAVTAAEGTILGDFFPKKMILAACERCGCVL